MPKETAKPYHIRWSEQSNAALFAITDYLINDSGMPWVARKTVANIKRVVDDYIAFMPRMFTQVPSGTAHACCLPYPYIIYYDIDEIRHSVTILDIIHGAQGERRR